MRGYRDALKERTRERVARADPVADPALIFNQRNFS
jgi:hypothetical protein